MIRAIASFVLLVLVAAPLGSCRIDHHDDTAPDREITCDNFADFQKSCTSNCTKTWNCETNYSSLSVDDQIALDDCSDCLVDNLKNGVCADCSDEYEGSCRKFMEDLLGTNCLVDEPAPDQKITCDNFADFQQGCTANCSVTWDCEANYASLGINDKIALDDCSDCLADNLKNGVCADCSDEYEGSCQAFMEDLLGVQCW